MFRISSVCWSILDLLYESSLLGPHGLNKRHECEFVVRGKYCKLRRWNCSPLLIQKSHIIDWNRLSVKLFLGKWTYVNERHDKRTCTYIAMICWLTLNIFFVETSITHVEFSWQKMNWENAACFVHNCNKNQCHNRHFIVIFNSHTDVELFSFDCYFKVLIKDDEIPVRTSDTIFV